jgi:outer membrane lipoprotein-sorting protein
MRKFLIAMALTALAPPLSLLPAAPAIAAEAAAIPASPALQADLTQIETYLNGLSTAAANFTFVAPDGQVSSGLFTLSRPGKLRFEYTDPAGNLLIADGDYVIYWDAAQKEESSLPIGQTPLSFLLRPHISLTDGVRVTGYEHAAGVIRLTLVQTADSGAGAVTVAFSDQPLELRGWRLVDPQGQITDVAFANWKLGMPVDSRLFHFESPRKGKRGR